MRSFKSCLSMMIITIAASGCALYTHTSFSEYRGPSEFIGKGGTVKTVEGIEVWTSGEPNRRFKVLGLIEQSHFNNHSVMSMIAAANKDNEIIALAKKNGGDAIVLIGADSVITGFSTSGYAQGYSTGIYDGGVYSGSSSAFGTAYTHANTQNYIRIAVIKYLD